MLQVLWNLLGLGFVCSMLHNLETEPLIQSIQSKINVLYVGLVVFLHLMALTIMVISATYLRNIFYIEKRIIAAAVMVLMGVSLVLVWVEVFKMRRVVVDANGIRIFNFATVQEIRFSDIVSIERQKSQIMMDKDIAFTDGFTYSKIVLKDGKPLVIAPDKFSNYLEIMTFIHEQMDESR